MSNLDKVIFFRHSYFNDILRIVYLNLFRFVIKQQTVGLLRNGDYKSEILTQKSEVHNLKRNNSWEKCYQMEHFKSYKFYDIFGTPMTQILEMPLHILTNSFDRFFCSNR